MTKIKPTTQVEVCHHQGFMSHYVIRVAIQPQGFQFLSPPFDAFASHPGQLTKKAWLPKPSYAVGQQLSRSEIQNSKGPQRKTQNETRQFQKCLGWVKQHVAPFQSRPRFPSMSAGEKEWAAVFHPSVCCACTSFISVLQFSLTRFNIWIVGSVSTYTPGVRRNPLYARLYIHI